MLKRGKKGQLMLFVIVAVLVVALGIMAWLFWPRIQEVFMTKAQAMAFLASQSTALQDSVRYCIKRVSTDLIKEQGLHAGYYSYSHLYGIDYAGPKLIVVFKDANHFRINELPSLDLMQKEFEKAMQAEGYSAILSCLNNFAEFKKKMRIEADEPVIKAEFLDETVIIKPEWQIKLKKARASLTLKPKPITLLIPVGRAWRVAKDIVNSEVEQKNFIVEFESYLRDHTEIMKHTRINAQNYPTAKQTIYMISTVPYRPGEEPFFFNFAVDRA